MTKVGGGARESDGKSLVINGSPPDGAVLIARQWAGAFLGGKSATLLPLPPLLLPLLRLVSFGEVGGGPQANKHERKPKDAKPVHFSPLRGWVEGSEWGDGHRWYRGGAHELVGGWRMSR